MPGRIVLCSSLIALAACRSGATTTPPEPATPDAASADATAPEATLPRSGATTEDTNPATATRHPNDTSAAGNEITWKELDKGAIYTPLPDQLKAQETDAFKNKTPTTIEFSFCVDDHGATTVPRIESVTPPDEGLEALVIDTVARWRFKPPKMFTPHDRVCTHRTFEFIFEEDSPDIEGPGGGAALGGST